ncbi:MAG TPA: ATPase, T2SS/T4P/T4SS family [Myxococcales bacterium]|nr:ATPase, T2SS/T4P/T4SS family [Myxococcales bacterium]
MGFSIILTEKGGGTRRLAFAAEEITIGRVDENDVCLPRGNISKKHTRIICKDGAIVVLDLKSTNGTYVNGKRLNGPQVVRPSDKIYIGDFILHVEPPQEGAADGAGREDAQKTAPPDSAKEDPVPASSAAEQSVLLESTPAGLPPPQPSAAPPPPSDKPAAAQSEGSPAARPDRGQILRLLHDRLIEALDLRRLDVDALGSDELRKRAEAALRAIVGKMDGAGELDRAIDREELVQDVLNEALGLGPLEAYLRDDSVTEIMVNSPSQVYVERHGRLQRADKVFSSAQAVLGVIGRIVAPLGRHIDESSPLVDARLADGSRVNAIIPPLALKGPCITIRKFRRGLFSAANLIERGTLTQQMASFLETCVRMRRNVVISGGTGSGKTTLLNVLSSFIPAQERILTIEDSAELQLSQEHWVALEARPSNIEGKGQVSIRELVRNALRMRPDRIVIGECRGGEALDMLQAMNTGHDGSLTTLHANSPRDALSRLETMVLMSGMELPVRAIREQIASAVHLIVQQTRFADGTRRLAAISEISGMELDVITLQDIFQFKQDGFDGEGRVLGRFVATGFVPKFYDDLQRRGLPVDMSIFREE